MNSFLLWYMQQVFVMYTLLIPYKIQQTLVISTSLISNNRFSRRENLIPVKHENLTIGNKIQYVSNFRSQITYSFLKCGCSIFFLNATNLVRSYVEVWISQSISESPLDFRITRVDSILKSEVRRDTHYEAGFQNFVDLYFYLFMRSSNLCDVKSLLISSKPINMKVFFICVLRTEIHRLHSCVKN